MSAVKGLARIALICRDAQYLAAFYHSAFGFVRIDQAPISDPAFASLVGLVRGRATVTSLRLGSQAIVLAEAQPAGRYYPDGVSGSDLRFQHFAIVVSDMTEAFARLNAVGGWRAISRDGPQALPASSGGVTAYKFRDPEGHPLELLAYQPESAPARWATRRGNTCLGIDHSAISVADTDRSVAFYGALGLERIGGSLNRGPEQERLDGIVNAVVEVTALAPPLALTPHVELLCYRGAFDRRGAIAEPNDVAATQLVFAVDDTDALNAMAAANRHSIVSGPVTSQSGSARILLRDPDGHLLCIEAKAKSRV